MTIKVSADNLTVELDVNAGQTVLDVLKTAGITIQAPCGGKGTCRKCQVLLRTEDSVSTALACAVAAVDGMTVEVEQPQNMQIEQGATGTDALTANHLTAARRAGLGVAFDLGTTTVVARLYDLNSGKLLAANSQINPQVVFGADVISRIDASMAGELDTMRSLISDALGALADSLLAQTASQKTDVVAITLAGNTVMQHIVCGLAPDSIGASPFEPLSHFGSERPVGALPAPVWLAPCVSGYVGGDITAGIFAIAQQQTDALTLFMDLGTNGEMALGDATGIVCCATAAGPVFEGANIDFGMPALPGAISVLAAKPEDQIVPGEPPFTIATIAGADPIGICGTGLIDAIAWMLDVGIVDDTGRLLDGSEVPEPFGAWIGMDANGYKCLYLTAERNIAVTQSDVRNLQLAKSAIWSGALTLLGATGRSIDDIACVQIAGGFGKALNLRNAARCGIFAPELLQRANAAGNTSIEGASAALLAPKARQAIAQIAQAADYIELSTSAEFNSHFMEQLLF